MLASPMKKSIKQQESSWTIHSPFPLIVIVDGDKWRKLLIPQPSILGFWFAFCNIWFTITKHCNDSFYVICFTKCDFDSGNYSKRSSDGTLKGKKFVAVKWRDFDDFKWWLVLNFSALKKQVVSWRSLENFMPHSWIFVVTTWLQFKVI